MDIEQELEYHASKLRIMSAVARRNLGRSMEELKNGEEANEKIPDLLEEKALILMRIKKNR
jgi:hypothetical protein